MKQYLLAVHYVEGEPAPSDEAMQKMYGDVNALNDELKATGAWVFGGGLHEPSASTVVSVKDGKATMTDGPFAEAKEHLAGFWVLKLKDLDEALSWAKRASVACLGPVEVRPLHDEPGAD